MSIHEQTARMAPRPTTPTDAERDEYIAKLEAENDRLRGELAKDYADRIALKSIEIVDGKVQIAIEDAKSVMRDYMVAAVAILDAENPTNYLEMEAGFRERPGERFALTLQRVGKLTPHAARVEAERELGVLRGLIREVTRQSYHVGFPPTREWTAPSTATYSVHVPQDLYDRLVAAGSEGQ